MAELQQLASHGSNAWGTQPPFSNAVVKVIMMIMIIILMIITLVSYH